MANGGLVTEMTDIFDDLVERAESRHKDWNAVLANVLREMDRKITELLEYHDTSSSSGGNSI